MKDPKNRFYRTLKLDKESSEILKWFRKVKKQLLNEEIKEEDYKE